MARKLRSDAVLFSATLVLLLISMAWVYSASVVKDSDGLTVVKQGMWVALGIALLMVAMRVDYRVFRNRTLLLWLAGLVSVALVAVLFGHSVKGGRRWLGLGVLNLGVQPSEFAKIVAIFFVASVLDRRLEDQEPLDPGLFQAGAMLTVFMALIMREPDYGSAIVLLAAALVMMFVAGLPYRWVATAALALPPPILAVLWFSPHSQKRLLTFWDPWRDPLGDGYQTIQSWIAVATGGVWGKGFLESAQKMFYLPEPQNDYIFAVIAEEKGLIGAAVVLSCFALIAWRGLRVARRAPDAFGSLVAVGITSMIAIQAMVNMGVVVGILPAKGIPLPFVSAGGSSMVVSLVAMGVLLNISQQASATE
jgi:cell division protein FtsW